jgi:hypothetical protein
MIRTTRSQPVFDSGQRNGFVVLKCGWFLLNDDDKNDASTQPLIVAKTIAATLAINNTRGSSS